MLSYLISACSSEKTYEYFISYPNEISNVLRNCENMSSSDKTCEAANKAANELQSLLLQAQSAPQDFGMDIIKLQMKLATNYQNVALRQEIQKRLVVIELLSSHSRN